MGKESQSFMQLLASHSFCCSWLILGIPSQQRSRSFTGEHAVVDVAAKRNLKMKKLGWDIIHICLSFCYNFKSSLYIYVVITVSIFYTTSSTSTCCCFLLNNICIYTYLKLTDFVSVPLLPYGKLKLVVNVQGSRKLWWDNGITGKINSSFNKNLESHSSYWKHLGDILRFWNPSYMMPCLFLYFRMMSQYKAWE